MGDTGNLQLKYYIYTTGAPPNNKNLSSSYPRMDPEDTPRRKKIRPHIDVKIVPRIAHGRSYTSTIISDQKTMMETLKYTRNQMDRDMEELEGMKDLIYKKSIPRKWTIPQSYLE